MDDTGRNLPPLSESESEVEPGLVTAVPEFANIHPPQVFDNDDDGGASLNGGVEIDSSLPTLISLEM